MPDIEMKPEPRQRWRRPEGSFEPSPAQTQLWGVWYYGEPDPHGWYLGWCPIHDGEAREGMRGAAKPTAQYSFVAGTMRCMGDPPCHAKRSVSLTNLLVLMSKAGSE